METLKIKPDERIRPGIPINEQQIGIEEKIKEAREKHNKFWEEQELPLI